jgi:hypothetical protein
MCKAMSKETLNSKFLQIHHNLIQNLEVKPVSKGNHKEQHQIQTRPNLHAGIVKKQTTLAFKISSKPLNSMGARVQSSAFIFEETI